MFDTRSDEEIAADLRDDPGPGYVEPDPLDVLAREERFQAISLGHQMRAMAAHVARVTAEAPWYHQNDACKAAYAEIGLRLGLGTSVDDPRIAEGIRLVEDLPRTLDAMCAGQLTHPKVRAIVGATRDIHDHKILAAVEEAILPIAAEFAPPRLREKIHRLIDKLDAEARKKRAEAARAERTVTLHREPDGMATIRALMPIGQALAAFGLIDTLAHAAKHPDDDRTMDQVRVDTFYDLIAHPGDQPGRISYEMQVIATTDLLLARDGAEPARFADGTAIPDDLARAIATDARWRLILTDPLTRHLVDLGAHTYAPGDKLNRFIKTRDRHCRFPGCGRNAKYADLDHTIKFRLGGRTVAINLSALCQRHHKIKDLPGWDAGQDPDTAAITFITPRRDRYTTRPPTVDGDEQPVVTVLATAGANEDPPPF